MGWGRLGATAGGRVGLEALVAGAAVGRKPSDLDLYSLRPNDVLDLHLLLQARVARWLGHYGGLGGRAHRSIHTTLLVLLLLLLLTLLDDFLLPVFSTLMNSTKSPQEKGAMRDSWES